MAKVEEKGFFPARPGFCEIGVASNFSFLRGASHPKELVLAAELMELGGLGLADRNTVAGVVRAYQQARERKFPFRPGARLVFADETPDLFAYPRTRAGWGGLCRMLTIGNKRTVKGGCRLFLQDILDWGAEINLALLAPGDLGSAGMAFEAVEGLCRERLQRLYAAFPGQVRLAVAPRHDGLDARRLARAASLARTCRTPLLATNDVFYHVAGRRKLQDVVTSIREHVPLADAGFLLARNAERRLKSTEEMALLFRDHPEALDESRRFFCELRFDLKSLHYDYPDEKLRLGRTPTEELRALSLEGARKRYPNGAPFYLRRQIIRELRIIEKLRYEPYFLTVHRIVEAARGKEILCQGRGSAANSTVCYCIGVTEVQPKLGSLLFERFISPDRDEPPDIDIDFEHERREEIIQWIYEEYGRDNAALAATVITYRARSASREVGKAFGLSDDALSALSGSVWGYSSDDLGTREARAAGLSVKDPTTKSVLKLSRELGGFPRHLSQHVGGFVLTRGRVDETVPVLNTGMKGRTIVEWDKDDLDELHILKVDILALGMLTCLKRGFEMLHDAYADEFKEMPTLASITGEAKDDALYAMTHRADTLGVFQIESRAQMSMLPKLRPAKFYDFVIQVAIVRPGPIQGDMVHPYLKRRMEIEKVTYPSEELKAVLGRTLGIPLFQEQAMQIAMVAAGFKAAEADQLRRAMATFKRNTSMDGFKEKMIGGMIAKNYPPDFAERCFRQIEGFGSYGFPESHAASFALLVYASAWMKCHYPDVFAAALLNSQPMGFYAPAQIVRDAREHGVEMRPICINASRWDQTLEEAPFDPARIAPKHAEMKDAIETSHAVRLGFRQVKGLPESILRRLCWVRDSTGPYDSVRDVWLRAGLERRTIERLAEADAFACLGLSRREALWACRALDPSGAAERLPLFDQVCAKDLQKEPDAHLPPMPPGEEVVNDYRFLSLSLKGHPVSFLRDALEARRILRTEALREAPSGRRVTVSGLVLIRQRPGSAKGVIFMTVEDETGIANIIVWPKIFEIFRPVVLGARFVEVRGRLQSSHGVIHLVAERIVDLSPMLSQIAIGGLVGTAPLQPTDHVKSPLRSHHRQRAVSDPTAGITDLAVSLGSVLSRGDEVRHPVDEAAAVARPQGHRRGVEAAMPKGRNFH